MKILIIEDEIKTAVDLKETLIGIDGSIEVVSILDSIESSVAFFQNNSMPDLIFSDIQLADGLSFEIFKTVEVSCPVIFCTAFDEYAIEAFKSNGVDYILKPFDEQVIHNSINKIRKFEKHFISQNNLLKSLGSMLVQQKSYKAAFLVSFKGKMIPVSITDVASFFISNELVFIQTFSDTRYVLSYTLDEIENMIDPALFFRINRQYIINFKAVREIEPHFARKLSVKLSVPHNEPVLVSKAKAPEFLKWIENR